MTDRNKVIKAFEFCLMQPNKEEIENDVCSHDDCPYYREYNGGKCISASVSDALALLKALEPRVMTLEEVKHYVYGMPYIIETNKPRDEPRLMYGLYSHQGVNGCFYFAFTDARSHFFDADYGKRWRCWTSRPDDKRRAETPWE